MKILIICLHAFDRVPGQRFRFEQYLDYFRQNGIEYEFSGLLQPQDYKHFYKKGKYFQKFMIVLRGFFKRWRELKYVENYDLVFIQRESYMLGTTFFEKRYARRSKVVYDFDDAIWLSASTSGQNRKLAFLKKPSKTSDIIAVSTMVFAGNQFLADYASQFNDNVVIVPTTIDTREYQPAYKTDKSRICIGWSGSFSTIAHFETAIPALLVIKEKYGDRVYFKVIGDGNYRNQELGITGQDWKKETEVKDLQEIDIGIMPLPDDEWSKGKCGLKGLQYMGLEIPTIMSPVGVNSEIITDGYNGFLAGGTSEWVEKLSRLIDSPALRAEVGQNGRKTVVDKYSVEANKHLYIEYLTLAANGEKPRNPILTEKRKPMAEGQAT
jgi:glycosyltransferase involved in cell wall biosynthesis